MDGGVIEAGDAVDQLVLGLVGDRVSFNNARRRHRRAPRDPCRRTPPVLVLTARSTVDDRIHGLQLGADDYVTKPFSPAEVVLRVQAVLHRSGGQPGPGGPVTYGQGRLRIDEPRHEASLDGRSLDLTPTEWDLLAAVAAAPERVFSRYELVNRIRGYEYAGYERTIDSHVKNLRHKLGASGADVLETVLGVGYRLRMRRDDLA